ncbi:hypothetical protein PRZ48_006806 [Zasmidium cellare]|uniref:BTB domain-containing protein n=1 Tax=Zasmidium cellare TaxID=395010 RepID=A0ABR0EIK7_ZASCE|nr:hypothetical protein PRZ48_006806 [Zasmidium cellare]
MAVAEPPPKHDFKVIVGGDEGSQKSYTVHKDVLVKSSGFFQKACDKKWEEGKTKTITLPEANPEFFDIYLQILYTGQVVIADDDDLSSIPGNDPKAYESIDRINFEIVGTYLLADMLLDVPSKNSIVDYFLHIANIAKKMPPAEYISHLFESTLPKSPFRRLLVDLAASKSNPEDFRKVGYKQCNEFLVEVSYCLMKMAQKKQGSSVEESACAYHEHDEEHPKCT